MFVLDHHVLVEEFIEEEGAHHFSGLVLGVRDDLDLVDVVSDIDIDFLSLLFEFLEPVSVGDVCLDDIGFLIFVSAGEFIFLVFDFLLLLPVFFYADILLRSLCSDLFYHGYEKKKIFFLVLNLGDVFIFFGYGQTHYLGK